MPARRSADRPDRPAAQARPGGQHGPARAETQSCSGPCSAWNPRPQPASRSARSPYHAYLPMLGDAMLGPAAVYSALARLLGRLATSGSDGRSALVVIIDDAHLAGQALPQLAAIRAARGHRGHRRRGGPVWRAGPDPGRNHHQARRTWSRGGHRARRRGPRRRPVPALQRPPAVPVRASPAAGRAARGHRAARLAGGVGCPRAATSSARPERCYEPLPSSARNSTSTCSPLSSAAPSSTSSITPSRRSPGSS